MSQMQGLIDAIKNSSIVGGFVGNISSVTADLKATVGAGYNMVIVLGDAVGAKKLSIQNSSLAEILSIDSLGNIIATQITASFVGDVQHPAPASHNYSAGVVDWTLSASELKTQLLLPTNSSGAVNIIAPTGGNRDYVVYNNTGYALTIKKSGGVGVTIANTKTAGVIYNGSDYVRVSADV
jgi:hypothetical protein